MQEQIKQELDKLRPMLQADGGDAELVEITQDGIVKVKFTGACSSCPMRQVTLKAGIEAKLKEKIPMIKQVEAV